MKFVLKHVFSNWNMKVGDIQKSEEVSHAGLKWCLSIEKKIEFGRSTFFSFVSCHIDKDDDWFIRSNLKIQMLSSGTMRQEETRYERFNKSCLKTYIQTHESAMMSFLVNDQIVLKCYVNITDASGIQIEDLKTFDESTKELADVVLAVGDEKFHVSKLTLANFSSYFKSLFLGGFEESGKEIIELKNVNPAHFQVYLEAIYGEPTIIDSSVERTLELAEMYDSPVVTRSCEVHLMSSSSKLPTKTKIRLCGRFKLQNLLQTHLDSSKSLQEIRSLLPADMDELDPIVAKAMFQRVLEVETNK